MADKTKISWTDASWNPVTGCTKVSPGCAYCYAERVDHRYDHDKVGKLPWALPASKGGRGVTLHPDRLDVPLRWKKPRKVFVNSMSDLFHEDIPDEFIAQVFAVMYEAKQHTFQVLTKRPERALRWLTWAGGMVYPQWPAWESSRGVLNATNMPLPNVWLGVSVENQHWANVRLPILAQIPAAVRFVSCEPLLGPLDLRPWLYELDELRWSDGPSRIPVGHINHPCLDWVIVGGESGPGARPMHPDWVRSIRGQCVAAGKPLFFKQWGEWSPNDLCDPEVELMHRVGKKAAGAMLDGREWREFPR